MTSGGVYIHIPFCVKKCVYCSFFSEKSSPEVIDKYVDELCREITMFAEKNGEVSAKTIYIGGGTPSVLNLCQIEKIFDALYNNFKIDSPEITIEVNPNSANLFKEYSSLGINRISIGIQSLSDDYLKRLGRLHTRNEAIQALEAANKYFNNISADLIIGIDENQKPEKDFIELKQYIKHLSAYMLTVEEGTPLSAMILSKKVSVATEDSAVDQYNNLLQICEENGFIRYETSNFALKNYESKHNSSYWNLTPYIGFGPGAHSYWNGERFFNEPNLNKYLHGEHIGGNKAVSERKKSVSEDKNEFVMLSLRTVKGIDLKLYREKFGVDFFTDYGNKIKTAEKYLFIDDKFINILPRFFLLHNSVIEKIIF